MPFYTTYSDALDDPARTSRTGRPGPGVAIGLSALALDLDGRSAIASCSRAWSRRTSMRPPSPPLGAGEEGDPLLAPPPSMAAGVRSIGTVRRRPYEALLTSLTTAEDGFHGP
jgi:hypothetical protein